MTTKGAPLVELHGVWRRYRMSRDGRSATLRGTISGGRRSLRRDWFWALRGVDLALHRGEAVAVIGPNGAGKSTLLRLAGGLGKPDRGSVRRSGRIGAMLDLGRELHPDLTGRENAELVAVVAGLTRAEFRRQVGAMLDFAGLHEFAEQPLHVYSDGMRARLAFSVLAHVEPDVLLVDEVLAVGDHAFQERCIDRIEQMRTAGTGVLLVSHDLHTVQRVCDRAVWLQGGEVRAEGDPHVVAQDYVRPTGRLAVDADDGTAIHDVALRDPWGNPLSSLRPGQGMRVSWRIGDDPRGRRRRTSLVILREGHDGPVVDTSTPLTAEGESFEVTFTRLDLAAGRHHVVVAVYDEAWAERLGSVSVPLEVTGSGPDAVLAPPHDWNRRR